MPAGYMWSRYRGSRSILGDSAPNLLDLDACGLWTSADAGRWRMAGCGDWLGAGIRYRFGG